MDGRTCPAGNRVGSRHAHGGNARLFLRPRSAVEPPLDEPFAAPVASVKSPSVCPKRTMALLNRCVPADLVAYAEGGHRVSGALSPTSDSSGISSGEGRPPGAFAAICERGSPRFRRGP